MAKKVKVCKRDLEALQKAFARADTIMQRITAKNDDAMLFFSPGEASLVPRGEFAEAGPLRAECAVSIYDFKCVMDCGDW